MRQKRATGKGVSQRWLFRQPFIPESAKIYMEFLPFSRMMLSGPKAFSTTYTYPPSGVCRTRHGSGGAGWPRPRRLAFFRRSARRVTRVWHVVGPIPVGRTLVCFSAFS